MKRCWYCLLLVLLVACQKDYSESDVSVLGHAGESLFVGRNEFPPNSIDGVKKAINEGAKGVEIDVQMTADGQLVAFHDEFLDENSNAEGCINELSWEELESVQIYQSDHTIALLKDVIEYPLNEGKQVMLDIKHFNACEEEFVDFQLLDDALNELLTNYTSQQKSNVWVNSRNASLLRTISDTDIKLSFEYDDVEEAINANSDRAFDMISIKLDESNVEVVADLKTHFDKVCIYNLISRGDVRKALSYGPDFVISDQLTYTLKLTNG